MKPLDMRYIPFHQYSIPSLILGTVQLGMDYGIANTHGRPSQAEAHQLLAAASANGITALDTSPTYGTSEAVIGSYLQSPSSQKLCVISKFKYDITLPFSMEKAWIETKSAVQQSLSNLGISKLPIALYHKAGSESMEQVKEVVPTLLDRLKNENLIEHGGISLYYSSEANELLDDTHFEVLQIPMNVLDQEIILNGTLEKLHTQGKLITIRSVFLQGLFWKNPQDLQGNLRIGLPYLQKLKALAQDYNLSMAELTFGFIRDLEQVDSLIIGAETLSQLEQNIQLLHGPQLPVELRQQLAVLSQQVPIELITPGLWK